MDIWEENNFTYQGEEKATLLSYRGEEGVVVVPEKTRTIPVESIGEGAFEGNKDILKIILPETVTSIGEFAFRNCRNLEEVHLSNAIRELPDNIFLGCPKLKKVNLPSLLERIPSLLFIHSCLKTVRIGKEVREIKNRSFNSNCLQEVIIDPENPYFISDGKAIYSKNGKNLVTLLVNSVEFIVPEGVLRIQSHAFENSASIRKISLPKSLKIIDDHAFFSTQISDILLPEGLEKIGNQAFKFCRNLNEILFPESLKVIGKEAFYDSGLTEVLISRKVRKIGVNAFTIRKNEIDTRGVIDFKVSEENPLYFVKNKGLFYRGSKGIRFLILVERIGSLYEIPEGTEILSDDLFSYHGEITEVILPDSLKQIGHYTFYYSSVEKINIPKDLESIGDYAFYQTKLKEIYLPKSLKILGKNCLSTRRDSLGGRFLEKIEVEEGNEKFFVDQQGLYIRGDKEISLFLFYGRVSSFYLPSYGRIIKEGAFTDSGVEEVFLHREITKIEKDAFIQCTALRRLIVELKDEKICSLITVYFPTLDKVYDDLNSYMNCIYYDGEKEVVDFQRYDSLFPIVRDWDEMIRVALSRLEYPCSINPKGEAHYRQFIRHNFKNIYRRVINGENINGLDILLEVNMPTEKQLEIITNYARGRHSAKVIAYLMNYKKEHFSSVEEDYEL